VQLAERLGKSVSYVSRLLTDERRVTAPVMVELGRMGVDVEELERVQATYREWEASEDGRRAAVVRRGRGSRWLAGPAVGQLDGYAVRALVDEGALVVDPWEPGLVHATGVDLRVGPGARKLRALPGGGAGGPGRLVLAPLESAVVVSLERLVLPERVVGHARLHGDFVGDGVMAATDPCLSPGWAGPVKVVLFNAGVDEFVLGPEEVFLTLELVHFTGRGDGRGAYGPAEAGAGGRPQPGG
jgi:deoxycytidine triphosphate deaminase